MTLKEAWDNIEGVAIPTITAIAASLGTGKYMINKQKAEARKTNSEANNLDLERKMKEDEYDEERYKKVFDRMVKAETERDQYFMELMKMKQMLTTMEGRLEALSARVNMLQVTNPTPII